jgi:hypothetical protein
MIVNKLSANLLRGTHAQFFLLSQNGDCYHIVHIEEACQRDRMFAQGIRKNGCEQVKQHSLLRFY